jgi:hypothetical protein
MAVTRVDLAVAIDTFMGTPKRVAGYDSPPAWAPSFTPYERVAKYPLELEGELRGAQLYVVGFPVERDLTFRLGILFPAMVCRLDYTAETHGNSLTGYLSGAVPMTVTGPHWHRQVGHRSACDS